MSKLLQIAAELVCWSKKAFDTWYGGKKQYDYGWTRTPPPDAKKGRSGLIFDLRTMVERGKTPAIVMWSIGNEGEADGKFVLSNC